MNGWLIAIFIIVIVLLAGPFAIAFIPVAGPIMASFLRTFRSLVINILKPFLKIGWRMTKVIVLHVAPSLLIAGLYLLFGLVMQIPYGISLLVKRKKKEGGE